MDLIYNVTGVTKVTKGVSIFKIRSNYEGVNSRYFIYFIYFIRV